jgi:hypothetical protein
MSNLTPIHQAVQSFLTIEHVAEELLHTTEWVESKCRRRCCDPIPFHNVGNHRLFVWSEVFNWVTSSPKFIHSRHRRRTKKEIDAVRKAKATKLWASKDLNLQPADYESDALTGLS